jgi:hypothetical protein
MADHVECKHCGQTGTCTNGPDRQSCGRCIAAWQPASPSTSTPARTYPTEGLVCAVCNGTGVAELSSSKWDYRLPAALAILLILFAFTSIFVFLAWDDKDIDKVLVFAGTLIGSVTGYYFGGERSRRGAQLSPVRRIAPPTPKAGSVADTVQKAQTNSPP